MITKGRPTSENERLITPNGQPSVQWGILSSIKKKGSKILTVVGADKIFLPIPKDL